MNRKEMNLTGKKNKGSSADLRRKEKEFRKLQQDFSTVSRFEALNWVFNLIAILFKERDKYNQMVARFQKDISEMQATLHEESQLKIKLQMELDSKDAEIEQLRQKLALRSSHEQIINSTINEFETNDVESIRLEGWLSIPNKQNIRRHGWRKQYVVVSSRKIIFYNSEVDKAKADPALILDLRWVLLVNLRLYLYWIISHELLYYSKLFHVRSVTQGLYEMGN